ncbi:MAG: Trk system potassium transporter TrkA [Gammaproteobacteria bacterium]|nr:Trk system potassium transporter TrkA [Gammaproteobacteria bacterium]
MNIIVAGCGKVGQEIVKHMAHEGHNIIVIESNPIVLAQVVDDFDVLGINGNAIGYDILEKANCKSTDIFIAVTSQDETNMMSCFVAKKLGAKSTIARIRKYNYSSQLEKLREDFGINLIINPEREAASDIINILNFPEAMEVDLFANGRLDLIEISLQGNNPLIGHSISEIRTRYNIEVLVCAVQSGADVLIPTGQYVLKEKDRIHIAAKRENAKLFLSKIGVIEDRVRNVMIIGCGILSVYLAEALSKNNYNVKIIEIKKDICERYASILPKVSMINGDGSNQVLLDEEGLNSTDALICLTGLDEENIIISMYAAKKNVHKVIAKVDKSSFSDLLEAIGGASVISPKGVISSRILSYVRAYGNASGSNIQTLYRIVGDKVEAIEFIAHEKSKSLNIPLKDLKLKKNILIASIIRGREVIIPSGNSEICAQDSVVVLTLSDEGLDDLDDILA